ncbi:pyridoxal phosphate-dependent aminotransferase [Geosporobacter ferrireducens]|uniref:pyridoxal phosphate-dependent aminotransferase n=1 Tax=Geosporobacter ferrireducens TaxID=1424294 RepID=UPI00139DF211|nr:pyridoxal phosphate-dependent aminotransferase [Geosporobacter ferrireducens]MTI58362.1 pyridoxal phosphate-dependent aminotransferase [Geosporobacter ferrireducens]
MLSAKLKTITPSFTIGISTKVKELKKQGEDIINLSIGEPDFSTPTEAKEGAYKAIRSNLTKYDSASGLLDLRKVIQEKLQRENNLFYSVDEIVVSNGAKHAITNTLITLLDPGDEVLIPKPYWVSYPEMVKLTGGVPVFVDTQENNSFKATPADIEKKITSRTKLIILTNPSNPTGAIYSSNELLALVELCLKHHIYILSDEIYEKICYLETFTSTASLSEAAKEITITVNGLSKSAAMTGWRIGYTAASKELSKAISTVQGHLISHPSTISQWASVAALTQSEQEMEHMVSVYRERRDTAVSLLSEIEGIDFIYPEGAFYVFIDLSALASKFHRQDSFSVTFADKLLEEAKVAVVPGIAFGMDHHIRISYACDTKELVEGIRRIKNFIEKY